jgi:hypothetical protein
MQELESVGCHQSYFNRQYNYLDGKNMQDPGPAGSRVWLSFFLILIEVWHCCMHCACIAAHAWHANLPLHWLFGF